MQRKFSFNNLQDWVLVAKLGTEIKFTSLVCRKSVRKDEAKNPTLRSEKRSISLCKQLLSQDFLLNNGLSSFYKPWLSGELLLLSSAPDPAVFPESDGGRRRRPPNLGEIEQFSTETQTDFDLIQMLKRTANSPTSDDEDDPMFGYPISRLAKFLSLSSETAF